MKKVNLRYVLFSLLGLGCLLILISVIRLVFLSPNNKKYTRPSYDYSALIYHSEMLGMDAGTEYIYSIYKEEGSNTYFYIKSKASITIEGSKDEKDIDSGSIRNKKDLERIEKDIEKDKRNDSSKLVSYLIYDNGIRRKCASMEELGNKLFK